MLSINEGMYVALAMHIVGSQTTSAAITIAAQSHATAKFRDLQRSAKAACKPAPAHSYGRMILCAGSATIGYMTSSATAFALSAIASNVAFGQYMLYTTQMDGTTVTTSDIVTVAGINQFVTGTTAAAATACATVAVLTDIRWFATCAGTIGFSTIAAQFFPACLPTHFQGLGMRAVWEAVFADVTAWLNAGRERGCRYWFKRMLPPCMIGAAAAVCYLLASGYYHLAPGDLDWLKKLARPKSHVAVACGPDATTVADSSVSCRIPDGPTQSSRIATFIGRTIKSLLPKPREVAPVEPPLYDQAPVDCRLGLMYDGQMVADTSSLTRRAFRAPTYVSFETPICPWEVEDQLMTANHPWVSIALGRKGRIATQLDKLRPDWDRWTTLHKTAPQYRDWKADVRHGVDMEHASLGNRLRRWLRRFNKPLFPADVTPEERIAQAGRIVGAAGVVTTLGSATLLPWCSAAASAAASVLASQLTPQVNTLRDSWEAALRAAHTLPGCVLDRILEYGRNVDSTFYNAVVFDAAARHCRNHCSSYFRDHAPLYTNHARVLVTRVDVIGCQYYVKDGVTNFTGFVRLQTAHVVLIGVGQSTHSPQRAIIKAYQDLYQLICTEEMERSTDYGNFMSIPWRDTANNAPSDPDLSFHNLSTRRFRTTVDKYDIMEQNDDREQASTFTCLIEEGMAERGCIPNDLLNEVPEDAEPSCEASMWLRRSFKRLHDQLHGVTPAPRHRRTGDVLEHRVPTKGRLLEAACVAAEECYKRIHPLTAASLIAFEAYTNVANATTLSGQVACAKRYAATAVMHAVSAYISYKVPCGILYSIGLHYLWNRAARRSGHVEPGAFSKQKKRQRVFDRVFSHHSNRGIGTHEKESWSVDDKPNQSFVNEIQGRLRSIKEQSAHMQRRWTPLNERIMAHAKGGLWSALGPRVRAIEESSLPVINRLSHDTTTAGVATWGLLNQLNNLARAVHKCAAADSLFSSAPIVDGVLRTDLVELPQWWHPASGQRTVGTFLSEYNADVGAASAALARVLNELRATSSKLPFTITDYIMAMRDRTTAPTRTMVSEWVKAHGISFSGKDGRGDKILTPPVVPIRWMQGAEVPLAHVVYDDRKWPLLELSNNTDDALIYRLSAPVVVASRCCKSQGAPTKLSKHYHVTMDPRTGLPTHWDDECKESLGLLQIAPIPRIAASYNHRPCIHNVYLGSLSRVAKMAPFEEFPDVVWDTWVATRELCVRWQLFIPDDSQSDLVMEFEEWMNTFQKPKSQRVLNAEFVYMPDSAKFRTNQLGVLWPVAEIKRRDWRMQFDADGFCKNETNIANPNKADSWPRIIQASHPSLQLTLAPICKCLGEILVGKWRPLGYLLYASGLDAETLGQWYTDRIEHHGADAAAALTVDQNRFDSTVSEPAQSFKVLAYYDMGMSRLGGRYFEKVFTQAEKYRCNSRCRTATTGVEARFGFTAEGGTRSGMNDTSTGNSACNGAVALAAIVAATERITHAHVTQFSADKLVMSCAILGDDAIFVFRRDHAEVCVQEVMRAYSLHGFNPEASFQLSGIHGTFLSKCFYPTATAGRDHLKCGPPIGRILARTCWSTRYMGREWASLHAHHVYTALLRDCSHIPILSTFLRAVMRTLPTEANELLTLSIEGANRLVQEATPVQGVHSASIASHAVDEQRFDLLQALINPTGAGPAYLNIGRWSATDEHAEFTGRASTFSPVTTRGIEFVCHRYGITTEQVKATEAWIDKHIKERLCVFGHPVLDSIIRQDLGWEPPRCDRPLAIDPDIYRSGGEISEHDMRRMLGW